MWPFSRTADQAIVVEQMERDDYPWCADIHAATFSRNWTDGEIAQLMNRSNTRGWIARSISSRKKIAGFVIISVAADEAEILTIAVKPSWQGYGVGRKLMDKVCAELHADRAASVFLEVDENNRPAIRLYQKVGFEIVGQRKNYYRDEKGLTFNAHVMRRSLD